MGTYFTEVLARESARLSEVGDGATLASWRRGVVEELMSPQSPYVLALRRTDDIRGQAEFLHRWRELIAIMVERLLRSGATLCTSGAPSKIDVDNTAVLILAALRGGSALSQLARDSKPLDAALDLALVPFAQSRTTAGQQAG
jgi:hypothetical protein